MENKITESFTKYITVKPYYIDKKHLQIANLKIFYYIPLSAGCK